MKKNKISKSVELNNEPILNANVEPTSLQQKYWNWIALISIIILGSFIYSNTFSNSFQFDDKSSIIENPSIRKVADLKEIWSSNPTRFVSYYSLALNYHFGKLNPWGYHLVNLWIHILTSILVFLLIKKLLSTPYFKGKLNQADSNIISLSTALLFVSHPLATQSVSYIIQRTASLMALFYLTSIYFYLKARLNPSHSGTRNLAYLSSFIFAILAFLTKENSFSLPVTILLVELLFIRLTILDANFKSTKIILSFIGATIIFIILVSTFGTSIFKTIPPDSHNDYRTISSFDYLCTQFSVIVKYIQLLILPLNLNLDYDYKLAHEFFEPRTILSFLFLCTIVASAIYHFNKQRLVSFGIFWFFITLFIESSIKPISDLIFEHRTYLPSIGYFLVLSYLLYSLIWNTNRIIFYTVILSLILVNSFLTFQRNKVWKDEQTLWNDVIQKSPNKARGYFNLALQASKNSDNEKALEFYNKVIKLQALHEEAYNNRALILTELNRDEEALADYNKLIELYPKSATSYNGRASYYVSNKRFSEALQDVNKSLEIKPIWEAFNNRGMISVENGKLAEGISDFNKSIQLNPNNSLAYYSLGIAYEGLNDKPSAFKFYSKAIALKENYIEAIFRLANLLSSEGKFDEALIKYNEITKISPKFVDAYNNRGNVYVNQKKYAEALQEFNKAVELNPSEAESYNNRGTVFMGNKKYADAIEDFNTAIELNPKFAMAYANRGICYINTGRKSSGCNDLNKSVALGFQAASSILINNCR